VVSAAATAQEPAGVVAPHALDVTVTGLCVCYGGRGEAVLDDVAFTLPSGRRLAIVGASGCGKSTLLNVLAGLLAPAAGRVEAGGHAVASAGLDGPGRAGCRSGHAAYMFQNDLLLPWRTVLGNATMAAEAGRRGRTAPSARRADGAVREARARAVLAELGLGAVCDVRPDELSGGMRQRVALARTLVAGKGLVLLDEPFGSLDTLTRAEARAWLLEAMEAHPATWVLVTHDVREAVLLGDVVAVLGGRPARLHGWVETGLTAEERLRVARREAGASAAGPSDAGPAPAEERVRALTAEVLAELMAGRVA